MDNESRQAGLKREFLEDMCLVQTIMKKKGKVKDFITSDNLCFSIVSYSASCIT